MSGSYNFLFHLVGFGFVAGIVIANVVLDRKFRREPDWGKKLYIGGIMKTFGMFGPFITVLLLITGIGNIHNLYIDAPEPWYAQGWLVMKVILFAVMATNGLVFGPGLSKKRIMLIKGIAEKSAPADAEESLKVLNNQISIFLLVQSLLLISIIFLSAFGTGKHPGMF